MDISRLKAATGVAMSGLWRLFAPGDSPRCQKHGVRLRRMARRGRYYKETLCPVCHRRTVSMKAYPFKIYIPAGGMVWSAIILALGAVTVWGVVPGVGTLARWDAESAAAKQVTLDAMPREWSSLYHMLEEVTKGDRGEAFMEYATGDRNLVERSPVRLSLPPLPPEGAGLFMSLFDSWDGEYVLPVVADLGATLPDK